LKAIVTGGSAGIGKAVCERLLAEGHEVWSLADRPASMQHERLHSVRVDLSDVRSTRKIAEQICTAHAITTLVHNAGVIRPALLPEVKLEDVDALVRLHLSAAITLVQAALPAMQAERFGRIILVSSRAALGLATRTAYSATKSGMIGMARTWALELGPQGITVNVVAPGPILTDMFHEVIPAGSPKVQAIAQSIPVKRIGVPEDVARAVMFFAGRDSGFVTGQVLFVCGGTSIGNLTF
jgi:NAD(P)-dependent dehydrogenase (short-subunit alcohol dehydrogenase family)